MTDQLRLVLADDHAIFRQGLAGLLEADSEIALVGQAADGDELLKLLEHQLPDVAVADLSMPGASVGEVAQTIEKRGWPTKLMVLTMHDSSDMARHVLEEGVAAYLLKKNAFDELRVALETVMRGESFVSPSLELDLSVLRGGTATLTPREIEIVRLVAQGHTNQRIGSLLSISTKTVQTHRARAMDKLHVHSAAELVTKSTQLGLLG